MFLEKEEAEFLGIVPTGTEGLEVMYKFMNDPKLPWIKVSWDVNGSEQRADKVISHRNLLLKFVQILIKRNTYLILKQ